MLLELYEEFICSHIFILVKKCTDKTKAALFYIKVTIMVKARISLRCLQKKMAMLMHDSNMLLLNISYSKENGYLNG